MRCNGRIWRFHLTLRTISVICPAPCSNSTLQDSNPEGGMSTAFPPLFALNNAAGAGVCLLGRYPLAKPLAPDAVTGCADFTGLPLSCPKRAGLQGTRAEPRMARDYHPRGKDARLRARGRLSRPVSDWAEPGAWWLRPAFRYPTRPLHAPFLTPCRPRDWFTRSTMAKGPGSPPDGFA